MTRVHLVAIGDRNYSTRAHYPDKIIWKKILKKTGKRSRWYRQYFERNIYTNWKISRLFTLKVQSNISIRQTETNWQISGQSQHKSAQINRVINSTQTFIGDAIKTNSTNILRWPFHSFHSDSIRTHFFFPNISVAMAIGYFRLIKLKQPDSNSIPISCPSTEKKLHTHNKVCSFIHNIRLNGLRNWQHRVPPGGLYIPIHLNKSAKPSDA